MGVPGYLRESLSTVVLKAGSLTKPGARQLTRLADQQVSGILLCPVCCPEIADVVITPGSLHEGWGLAPNSSRLYSKH